MKRRKQRGAALILTMILLAVISIMAVSMMFLSQSETWASANYRLMNQARDASEAGLNRAANFIMFTYTPPATAAELADFNRDVYPVEDAATAEPIVLTAGLDTGDAAYPDSTVQDAFDAASQGTLTSYTPSGSTTLNYQTSARLLRMRQVNVYGIAAPQVVQRWEINSEGTIDGVQNAVVGLSAVLDRTTGPTFSYAAYGVSDECDPAGLTFGGDASTDSYDSRDYNPLGGGTPEEQGISENCADPDNDPCAGDVGTNGSLALSGAGGSVDINGSLSTPRTGVGACEDNFATESDDVLAEELVQLTQLPNFPDPDFPTAPTPLLVNQSVSSAINCLTIAGCTSLSKTEYALAPGAYGNLTGGANTVIHLSAGTYNINSLDLGSNVTVVIDNGPVILNVAGCETFNSDVPPTGCAAYLDVPMRTTGGSFTNDSYNAENLQIMYAGEGELQLRGTSGLSAVVYAPSAHVETVGTTDLYGSIIGYTVDLTGTANIHYDRALSDGPETLGNYMMQSFSWKKY